MHWLCIGAVFGGSAIELAGRAVDPAFQASKLGSYMLQTYLLDTDTKHITTYTRNPSVLKMIRTVAHTIYPINDDKELEKMAMKMDNVTVPKNGVCYHINRYGSGGLYGGSDPAERSYFTDGTPLKDTYHVLQDTGTALVVAARVMPHVVRASLQQATDITKNTYNGGQDD